MVFAGATLATACGPKPKPVEPDESESRLPDEREEQDHPCVEPNPERIKAAEQKLADAKTDDEKQQAQNELDQARQPMCAPYGAPPARRRIV